MELAEIVGVLADGIARADRLRPIALNGRTGVPFQPGIGPHTESQTIRLALDAVAEDRRFEVEREVPYPNAKRARCDLVITSPEVWAIEVKMLRLMGDNGRPNDNMLMHILSPYPVHRSALTDFVKLLDSGLPGRKAIMVFGYDYESLPMDPAIEALELLASRRVHLVDRAVASFEGLVHLVHKSGRVFAWEISAS